MTAVRICCIIWCFLCVISLSAEAQKGKYFEKNVRFPEKITLEEKVDMAARLVPTKKQLAWQQLELTAFIPNICLPHKVSAHFKRRNAYLRSNACPNRYNVLK